jgi:hypothetical protein
VSSPYLDRLLTAAMKRRAPDTLAVRGLTKATHLLGLALSCGGSASIADQATPPSRATPGGSRKPFTSAFCERRSTSWLIAGTGFPNDNDPTTLPRTAIRDQALLLD